jgi:hypothetical protein
VANVWSIGIFAEDGGFDLIKERPAHLSAFFNGRKIRRTERHVHTYADPFLFGHDNNLYLFAEIQEVSAKGYINCWRSQDLKYWKDEGAVLKENYHLSYPFVFKIATGEIFMIPESGEDRSIVLYSFDDFPHRPRKVKTLLQGSYADTNVWQQNGLYYLFTMNMKTSELELFSTDNLCNGRWQRHPASPVSRDPTENRNGGGFIQRDGRLFRIAQDNSRSYGGGIVLLEVLQLDKDGYREKIVIENYGPLINFQWQRKGRHHLSLTTFKGKTVIAMDGLQRDIVWNKLINLTFKFISR